MTTARIVCALLLSVTTLSTVDAVAPGPPQNFTATVTGSSVSFSWQPPSIGGVPTSYVIEAALSPGGATIASVPVSGGPLVVPNVPNGVYYVTVRGLNADGSGERSSEVLVSVPSGGGGACATAPNSPTNLTVSAAGNVVTVTWSPPLAGCPATSYAVQAGSGPGLSNLAVVNVGAALALSASAPSGTYYIRVIGLNAYGGSVATADRTLTIFSAPAPPPAPAPTPPPPTPPPTNRYRIGAVCKDGSLSTATGSGACSHHGGVSCWRYSDGTCTATDVRESSVVSSGDTHREFRAGLRNVQRQSLRLALFTREPRTEVLQAGPGSLSC